MNQVLRVAVLVALGLVLGGSRCDEDEAVPLEVLRSDVAPPFDYAVYCDARGRLTGRYSDVLLVHRSEHLERVYADARRGDARARVLFGQLEAQVEASGHVLADQALGMVCTALPACTVQWRFLDELMPSRGAGGMRLRQVLATSFEQTARHKGVQNAVITAVLSVLLAGTVLEVAEGRAALAEARKLAGEAALETRLVEGLPQEEAAALRASLTEAEALEPGARHPAKLEVLARYRPSVTEPPRGVAAGDGRWMDYVAYWERRYEELAGTRPRPPGAFAAKPPLAWEGYRSLLGRFQRAMEFQRDVARVLQQEARLPKAQRHWLRGLEEPLVTENVGLGHEGFVIPTYVDQLVVDEASLRPGRTPTVHSFSNKQRDFSAMSEKQAIQQLRTDAREALTKYGGQVEIRRPGRPLFGRKVSVSRVHLVYEEQQIPSGLTEQLTAEAEGLNIELHFHAKQ